MEQVREFTEVMAERIDNGAEKDYLIDDLVEDSEAAKEPLQFVNFEEVKANITCREYLVHKKMIAKDDDSEMIICPLHDDNNPSFHFLDEDRRFHCFGCLREGDVIALASMLEDCTSHEAAGILMEIIKKSHTGQEQKFETFDYCKPDGTLIYQCCRTPDKKIWYRHLENGKWVNGMNGVTPVLMGMDQWSQSPAPIFIVEGEKCVKYLSRLSEASEGSFYATTNPFGAGRWRDEYSELLEGKTCYILPDNDVPGIRHAKQVAASLWSKAAQVKIVNLPDLPEKGDVADWICANENKYSDTDLAQELLRLTAETPELTFKEVDEFRHELKMPESKTLGSVEPDSLEPVRIQLPNNSGRTISEYAHDVVTAMCNTSKFFVYGGNVVHIDKKNFVPVSPEGFIIDIETYVTSGTYRKVKDEKNQESTKFFPQSMTIGQARSILKSTSCCDLLPEIKGILDFPLFYLVGNSLKLTPVGYCSENSYWTKRSNLKIQFIPVEEARAVINDLFSEFCFLEPEVDRSVAIAMLLTPALELLLNGERAPVFLADANRVGVGKDYLLGVVPVLYTGENPNFYAPCQSEDEWRKRIYSSCMAGEHIMIVSNVKGHLNSPSLEAAATSSILSDRQLGSNITAALPNHALYAISGNGLTYSDDMGRRIMKMRMEWYDENIIERTFKRNLYDYILENRERILSAVFSCIRHWHTQGRLQGRGMPSFDRWARIVTGIMTVCELGNPFQARTRITASLLVGGDKQNQHMKELVTIWAKTLGEKEIEPKEIRELAKGNQLFTWLEMDTPSGMAKFGKILSSNCLREYAGYRIVPNQSKSHPRYRLEQISGRENIPMMQENSDDDVRF